MHRAMEAVFIAMRAIFREQRRQRRHRGPKKGRGSMADIHDKPCSRGELRAGKHAALQVEGMHCRMHTRNPHCSKSLRFAHLLEQQA